MSVRRVPKLCVLLAALLLFLSSVPVHADDGSWCPIKINQNSVNHIRGCTVCSFQLVLENSGLLKSEYQLPTGVTNSRTDVYVSLDRACADNGIANGWESSQNRASDSFTTISGACAGAAALCQDGVTWSHSVALQSDSTAESANECIIGLGSKDFLDMSVSEFATAMKPFWNDDYYVIVALRYTVSESSTTAGRGTGNSYAGSEYAANHWVMLEEITDDDVTFNNPGGGSTTSYKWGHSYGGSSDGYNYYKVAYVVALKNNQPDNSPRCLSGGKRHFVTATDTQNLSNMGVSGGYTMVDGALSFNSDIYANCKLTEANLSALLDAGDIGEMSQVDRDSLEGWKTNIEASKLGLIDILRMVVQIVGILIMVWALFVYLAFWFDHINSFFYLDALHLVTLGQLHICPPNEKPTFGARGGAQMKTVSHLQILCICITAILFGALLISGVFYRLVASLVRLITGFIWG